MFYHGDECDPNNDSMNPVFAFKPFRDSFASWMLPGIADNGHVIAQYDGAIACMDSCIQTILNHLETRGVLDGMIVALVADHGETLYEHECGFDHHGLCGLNLHVPLIVRYPPMMPAGLRLSAGRCQFRDLVPTVLEFAGIESEIRFDGRSLVGMVRGAVASHAAEICMSECTWMRERGWRTPQWKLIRALEPDFHSKPPVELYYLIEGPLATSDIAADKPEVVHMLSRRIDRRIAVREDESGLPNPIICQGDWHGHEGIGSFKSSQHAYDALYIGDSAAAKRISSIA